MYTLVMSSRDRSMNEQNSSQHDVCSSCGQIHEELAISRSSLPLVVEFIKEYGYEATCQGCKLPRRTIMVHSSKHDLRLIGQMCFECIMLAPQHGPIVPMPRMFEDPDILQVWIEELREDGRWN